MLSRSVAAAVALAVAAAFAAAAEPAPPPGKVSYYKDIRPVLQQHCQGCHQPAKAQGGYVMTEFAAMFKAGESGKAAIAPGKPEKSYLLELVRTKMMDGKAEMPKNRDPLPDKQIKLIEAWIAEGAADDTPASAKAALIDADHPPVYAAQPVITSLAFSPDGKLLAVSGYHEILLHKADGSGLVARLVGMSERIQSVAFSADGKYLAASGGAPGRFGEIQVWDVAKRELKMSAPVSHDTLYGVSWSPDGKTLAFGCGDNTVRAIDASSGRETLFMGTHADWVLGTAFSRDGQHVVSVSRDMTVKLTEVATQRFIDNVTSITPGALKGGLMAIDVRPEVAKKTTKVPLDDGGKFEEKPYDELVAAGSDGTPRLYKMHRETKRVIGDDANKIRQYEPLPGRVSSVRFDTDGEWFAAASSLDGKGEVRVYAADSGRKVATCEKVTGPVYAVAWHPVGEVIASGGFDGKVWLHDPATGKLIKEFDAAPVRTAKK
jgi:WD40 repeat protein/mono/diheme cytochrome c family protein